MSNHPSRQKAFLYLIIVTLLLAGCDLGRTEPVTYEPSRPTIPPRIMATLVPGDSPTATLTPYAVKSFAPIVGGADKLVGAGASLPALLYASYFDAYHSQYKTQVDYYPTDSGLGIRQFGSKTVDFAATDVPLTDTQMVSPTIQGGAVQHIPTAVGGIAIVYNLPNYGARLRFSANTLADIYRGAITSWADPLIASDNPNVELPDKPITVLHRTDYSGSSYIFSQYLAAHNDNFRYTVGAAAIPRWPVGSGVQDSFEMVRAIKQKQYSIGYVSLGYAVDNNLPFADLENKAGNFVSPNPETLANAAATITMLPDDLRISLVDPPGWNSYPLTGLTWLLVYRDQTDMPRSIAIVNLLRWILTVGQASNAAHQFAPLPPFIAARADLLIQQLNVNGTAIYGTGFKPSPTPTLAPTVTGTPPTRTPTASTTPTQTVAPTGTPTPLATYTPNLIPTAPLILTPTFTPRPRPTNTPLPPTDTPPPPINTLPPPTNTLPPPPPPTDTPAGPPPTDTPLPPPPPRPRPSPTEGRGLRPG
jgi:phosphate transport system substrate-binding protein